MGFKESCGGKSFESHCMRIPRSASLLLPSPCGCSQNVSNSPIPTRTNVVLFFAGDGVAADLSVLDGRKIPGGEPEENLLRLGLPRGPGAGGNRVLFLLKELYPGGRGSWRGGLCCHRVADTESSSKPSLRCLGNLGSREEGQRRVTKLTFSLSAPSHPMLPGGLACYRGLRPTEKGGQGLGPGPLRQDSHFPSPTPIAFTCLPPCPQ